MASMKDVARAAGVSVSTVSHVLNETRYVCPETKKRVNDTIAKMGYQPSSLARALKINRTHTLGMLVPNSTNPFFAEVLQGVEEACYARGYSLILCHSDNKADRQLTHLNTLIKKRVDALIVMTTHEDPVLDEQLSILPKLPMVVLDAQAGLNGCTIGDNSVYGGHLATSHLIGQGHSDIACLTGPQGHPRSEDRLRGFTLAMVDAGLPIVKHWLVATELTAPGGYRAMNLIFERCRGGKTPQAVFAFNDLIALGAYRAIQEKGLHIPNDISIIGYDDLELASYLTPSLSTIHQPSLALGEQAAAVLISHLETLCTLPNDLTLTPELIVRESVKIRTPHGDTRQS